MNTTKKALATITLAAAALAITTPADAAAHNDHTRAGAAESPEAIAGQLAGGHGALGFVIPGSANGANFIDQLAQKPTHGVAGDLMPVGLGELP